MDGLSLKCYISHQCSILIGDHLINICIVRLIFIPIFPNDTWPKYVQQNTTLQTNPKQAVYRTSRQQQCMLLCIIQRFTSKAFTPN
jgi:hypothetical protein